MTDLHPLMTHPDLAHLTLTVYVEPAPVDFVVTTCAD